MAAAGVVGAAFMRALFQADDPQAAAGKIKDAWLKAVNPGNIAVDRGSSL